MNELNATEQILDTIYREDPRKWPHGLTTEHFDGGLWLIKQASTPVGFVGWQERLTIDQTPKRIGYYSIGILPGHRGCKYAKAAIKRVVGMKKANVDEVRALIVENNMASQGLAESLKIPYQVVKTANAPTTQLVVNWDGSIESMTSYAGVL